MDSSISSNTSIAFKNSAASSSDQIPIKRSKEFPIVPGFGVGETVGSGGAGSSLRFTLITAPASSFQGSLTERAACPFYSDRLRTGAYRGHPPPPPNPPRRGRSVQAPPPRRLLRGRPGPGRRRHALRPVRLPAALAALPDRRRAVRRGSRVPQRDDRQRA